MSDGHPGELPSPAWRIQMHRSPVRVGTPVSRKCFLQTRREKKSHLSAFAVHQTFNAGTVGCKIQMSPEETQRAALQLVKEMVLDDKCHHLSVSWRGTRKSQDSCILAARALIDLDSSFRTEDCEWITSGDCRPSSEGYRCTVLPYHSSCSFWNYTMCKQLKPGYVYQLKHCIHPDRLSEWQNGGETKFLTRKYVNERLELSKQRQTELTSSLTSRDISIYDD